VKIGIDARVLERRMTGIGRFLNCILQELPGIDSTNDYYLFSNKKLVNIDTNYFNNVYFGEQKLHEKLYSSYWLNYLLPKYLNTHNIDIFFSPNQLIPFTKKKDIKYIAVIHDVFLKIEKEYHSIFYRKYLDFFLNHAVKASDLIITVSEHSKKDILNYFDVNPQKVKVVYEAAGDNFSSVTVLDDEKNKLIQKYHLTSKIVLYVGVIENRKNILTILKVADQIKEVDKDITFLLIGREGYGAAKLITEINKRDNVKYINYVEEAELMKFYSISKLFLFPSFYEGFGLPPLEAMKSGIPVVSSNTSSLKEVIGEGGIMHDPDDYNSFALSILKLFSDQEYYNNWKMRGIKQSEKFNFTKTAEKLVKIFNTLQQ
jgi:glycosyltransferase involved in cell wall biosynthesis